MLIDTLRAIYNHPLNKGNEIGSIWRFFKWQIASRLITYPMIYPYTQHTKLLVWRGLTAVTGNLYCGLLEYRDMAFLLHCLRAEDLFIDIGANVGAYTVLAAGEVRANTIAIEPIPETFNNLRNNIELNKLNEKVQAINVGLGGTQGILKFTKSLDTQNRVALADEQDTLNVQIMRLDDIAIPQNPMLIKMDVEGFETEVIKGGGKTIANAKALIIELNQAGLKYGYQNIDIHQTLMAMGFLPYQYDPASRKLNQLRTFNPEHNTLYLKDIDLITQRLQTAPQFRIHNKMI
jgi:FkbM family methyltransferase